MSSSTASTRRVLAPFAIALALLVSACGATTADTSAGTTSDGCVTDYAAGKDYFPEKVSPEFATNFSVEYHDHYKVVTVKQPYQGGPVETYVLNKCGTPAPDLTGDLAKAPVIEIPVHRVASESTTHLPDFDLLQASDAVVAVSKLATVSSEPIRKRIDAGQVVEFKANNSLDQEKVIASTPDVFLTQGVDDPGFAGLRNAGIKVVGDGDWLEETPLGRAEWVKFVALFLDKEGLANEKFGTIRDDYQAVAAKARAAGTRPSVLGGSEVSGTWYAPGGKSYVAAEFQDAGGAYVYADDPSTGSVKLDIEKVLVTGRDSEFWLNATGRTDVSTLQDLVAQDPRVGELAAVKNNQVWTFTKRVNEGGGNDYYEGGLVRPDLVLADLVAILHPELMPDHEFTYYVHLA